MQEDLEKLRNDLDAMLAQYYPGHIEELATLTGSTKEGVEKKLETILYFLPGEDKYLVLDIVLTYYRIKTGSSSEKLAYVARTRTGRTYVHVKRILDIYRYSGENNG